MNIEFNNLEELYERILPALNTKKNESFLIYKIILNTKYIFNYLAETKWKSSQNLVLSEVVNDILNVDVFKVKEYQDINEGII